jgi:hypothetical protein
LHGVRERSVRQCTGFNKQSLAFLWEGGIAARQEVTLLCVPECQTSSPNVLTRSLSGASCASSKVWPATSGGLTSASKACPSKWDLDPHILGKVSKRGRKFKVPRAKRIAVRR